MPGSEPNWLQRYKPVSLAARWLWLSAAVLLAWVAALAIGWQVLGPSALPTASLAAGVCWLGASIALVLASLCTGPQAVLAGLGLGMIFRMGIPLGIALWLQTSNAQWRDAGFIWYVLAFYGVTLVLETWMLLPDPQASTSQPATSQAASQKLSPRPLAKPTA